MRSLRRPVLVIVTCRSSVRHVPRGGESSSPGGDDAESSVTPVTVDQVTSTPEEDTLSALTNRFHEDHPEPLIDPSEVISGGPPSRRRPAA